MRTLLFTSGDMKALGFHSSSSIDNKNMIVVLKTLTDRMNPGQ